MLPSQLIETPKTVMEKVGPNIISHVSNTYKTDYPPIIKIEPIMGIDFSITKHVLMLWIVAVIVSVVSKTILLPAMNSKDDPCGIGTFFIK